MQNVYQFGLTLIVMLVGWAIMGSGMGQSKEEGKGPASGAASAVKKLDSVGLEMTAEKVLERQIEVAGGRKQLEKFTSRVMKVTIEVTDQGLKGNGEIFLKAPNKGLSTAAFDGVGEFKQGFDGTTGWSSDPFGGLRTLSGAELARIKRQMTLHGELKWRDAFPKVELVGKEKVGDKEAYVVKLTPLEGNPITNYYDMQSGLLVRSNLVNDSAQGYAPLEVLYSDYREVDGVKLPFRLQQKGAENTLVITINEVKHNLSLDDAKFVKPEK